MLPQIIAGLGSFALAKLSGASTRNALISGLFGGATSFGIGQLTKAAGIPFDPVSGMVTEAPTGLTGFIQSQFAKNPKLAQSVIEYGSGIGGQIFTPALVGTAVGMSQEKPYEPDPITFDEGKEEREAAYARIKPQFDRIIQPRQYTQAERTYQVPYTDIPSMMTAKSGGIANIQKFQAGGVNYLPSKTDHDEKDINNYVRAHGYVEDGSGNGDKNEDTMLAQLADGEFVSRADAVLGAGIMAGANPEDFKEMRKKGAAFFYNQQDQFKRIHDLLNAN
tara:strand:+ start:2672 stop:3505 length:834 start_codon:yes stop_codon:yes gene_type:complete